MDVQCPQCGHVFAAGKDPAWAAWVRQRRQALGYTLKQVAEELGISPVYLSDIERGNRRKPRPASVQRLEDVLGGTGEHGGDGTSEDEGNMAGLQAVEEWMAAHDPALLTLYLRVANGIPRQEIADVHHRICTDVMFSGKYDHFTGRQAAVFVPRCLVETLETRR